MSDGPDQASDSRAGRRTRRLIGSVLAIAIVVTVFAVLLPRIVDYGEVWDVVIGVPLHWLVIVFMVGVLNHATYPFLYTVVIRGLRFRHALAVRLASTATANVVPGGGALGVGLTYMMLSSWGSTGPQIATAVMLTGIWNNLIKLLLPILAAALVVSQGKPVPGFVEAALIGLAAFAATLLLGVILIKSPFRRHVRGALRWIAAIGVRIFDRTGKGDPDAIVTRFLATLRDAVSTRWGRLAVAMVATYVSQYLVLLASLRAAGVGPESVTWTQALAGFALVRLIALVPITPGGVGLAELGVTAFLGSGLSDPVVAQVAAGVLLFRTMDYLLEIPAGVIAIAAWRLRRPPSGGRSGEAETVHQSPAVDGPEPDRPSYDHRL